MREPVLVDGGTALFHGDCLEVLREFPDACLDVVVTDPPYGLSNTDPKHVAETLTKWVNGDRDYLPKVKGGFMGKEWDSFVPPVALWDECLRVLKPGGYVLTFAGTRTVDLMGLGLRLAGFDVRDSVAWLYGSGFPKSLDVSKAIDKAAGAEREVSGTASGARNGNGQNVDYGAWGSAALGVYERRDIPATSDAERWQGWGTALKPAHEPILVARKPLGEKTVAANVLKHGTGALNIDGCRVGETVETWPKSRARPLNSRDMHHNYVNGGSETVATGDAPAGRWPANVVLDEGAAEAVDEQSGERKSGGKIKGVEPSSTGHTGIYGHYGRVENKPHTDSGGASRFFVTAEQDEACFDDFSGEGPSTDTTGFTATPPSEDGEQSDAAPVENLTSARFLYASKAKKSERPDVDGVKHPTVKPLSIMQWLIRLATPPGGVVLDPFAGSGTTLEAARKEGFRAFGIERDESYIPLIKARIERTPQVWPEVAEDSGVDEPAEQDVDEPAEQDVDEPAEQDVDEPAEQDVEESA